MPLDELLRHLKQRPFEPFRIHMLDGTTYDIHHPELVMASVASAIIGIPADTGDYPTYARAVTIALFHVTRLEPLGQQAAASANGPPRP